MAGGGTNFDLLAKGEPQDLELEGTERQFTLNSHFIKKKKISELKCFVHNHRLVDDRTRD